MSLRQSYRPIIINKHKQMISFFFFNCNVTYFTKYKIKEKNWLDGSIINKLDNLHQFHWSTVSLITLRRLRTYTRRLTSRGAARKDAKRTARSLTFAYLQPNFDERRPCLNFSHHYVALKGLVCFNVVFICCMLFLAVIFCCCIVKTYIF